MKTTIFAVIVGLLGIGAGIGFAYVEAGGSSASQGNMLADARRPALPKPGEKVPVAEFDSESFDFGAMERETTTSHEFIVTNAGDGPLVLYVGDTTCKCTVGKVSDDQIAPGDSVPVRLEWTARTHSPEFRQSATILTNDPKRRRVKLTVEGKVTESTSVSPSDLHFGKIPLGESRTLELFILSHHVDHFSVLGHEFMGIAKSEDFDVEIEPADRADLPDPLARSGYRVRVTIHDTVTHGGIRGWLRFKTDLKNVEQVDVPITGRVVTDVAIFGRNYNVANGVLRLGTIRSRDGKSAKLIVTVKGEYAKDVSLHVAESSPSFVTAHLGEAIIGKVVRMPLTIAVPPGAQASAFVGGKDGKLGRVVLETTHPNIPRIEIRLRFIVEK